MKSVKKPNWTLILNYQISPSHLLISLRSICLNERALLQPSYIRFPTSNIFLIAQVVAKVMQFDTASQNKVYFKDGDNDKPYSVALV